MKLAYPACFYKNGETGAYAVEVPDLPGCATGGGDLPEAVLMGVDAASGWILGELEEGNAVPEPSPVESIVPDGGGFVDMLALDIDAFAKKHGAGMVEKSVRIPVWLSTYVDARSLDLSALIQESLSSGRPPLA